MPGDTKIKPAPGAQSGWVDVDSPTYVYASRRQARDARRARLAGTTAPQTVTAAVQPVSQPTQPDTSGYSGLTARLYDRLTTRQGVSDSEARAVLSQYGYNASASYGHMREAGATHFEALLVVALGSPAISVTYGRERAAGSDHTSALTDALLN